MFYCYILKSRLNDAYYIGSCNDLKQRVNQHNKRQVPSTKRYIPWVLVHKEGFQNLRDARTRELQIKSWKKRGAIEKLIKTFQNF